MSNLLDRICEEKRAHIASRKRALPEAALRAQIASAPPVRGFAKALRIREEKKRFALIAEIKKASPSAGIIRKDFNPATLARAYENAGAACLSVLTDTPYFQGRDEYIGTVRQSSILPVLRKDFMIDPYQIYESRAIGADCVLLIMAALENPQAAGLEQAATECGMGVLVEVHDERELERALKHLKTKLIGINNRNLKTLAVDLTVSEHLKPAIPAGHTIVCESGIRSHDDLLRMKRSGIYCFLVGESLMREPDLEAATRELLEG
jgi:indole-3-glycerol phosphate synthase